MYAILFFLDALVLSKFILRWVTSSFWVTQMFILDAFNRWQNLISASHKTLFFLPNLIIEDKTSSSFWRIRFLASWKWCYQCDQDAAVFLEQNPVSYSSVGPAVVEEMDGDAVICQSEGWGCLLVVTTFEFAQLPRGHILCLTVDPTWSLVCSGLTSVRVDLSLDFACPPPTPGSTGYV